MGKNKKESIEKEKKQNSDILGEIGKKVQKELNRHKIENEEKE